MTTHCRDREKVSDTVEARDPERVMGFYIALWESCRRLLSGQLEQRLAREVTEVELNVMGVRVLLCLLRGEQRLTDIANTLVVALPNVSATVRCLEEAELVTRRLSSQQRRVTNICLTERGQEIAERLWKRMLEEITAQVSGWTDEELAAGEALMRRLSLSLNSG
jgi:DNA-binding MarR family transcriptional regulator